MLYEGLKGVTKDVDLSTRVPVTARESFGRALQRLSRELNMAIEEVSPGHFISLPQGTEDRHRYLGRQGNLEIFAFDAVSTALAKIARGRAGDITDVLAMIRAGQLRLDALADGFAEILPRVEAGQALKIGSDEYQQKMAGFLADARAQGLTAAHDDGPEVG